MTTSVRRPKGGGAEPCACGASRGPLEARGPRGPGQGPRSPMHKAGSAAPVLHISCVNRPPLERNRRFLTDIRS